jgi:hypothetical protein
MNVVTADAEVVQVSVGHTAEFFDCFPIFTPVVDATCEAHLNSLSLSFPGAAECGAPFASMSDR